jgi:hypothetical protein
MEFSLNFHMLNLFILGIFCVMQNANKSRKFAALPSSAPLHTFRSSNVRVRPMSSLDPHFPSLLFISLLLCLFLWELPYQVCLVDYCHCRITLI